MASIWDDLGTPPNPEAGSKQGPAPQQSGSIWDIPAPDAVSATPQKRGILGAANDYAIEVANAALQLPKAALDFASPGSKAAAAIEGLIQEGELKQSDVAKAAKAKLSRSMQSEDLGEQAKGAAQYVLQNPALAASQALGSFVGPGFAIKGGKLAAGALNLGEKATARTALGSGMATTGVLAGGDAAGDAYQTVMNSPNLVDLPIEERERLATDAARKASIVPFALGAASGMFGAEKALATGTKSLLKTGAAEFASEAIEEGGTKLSANIAAKQYAPETSISQGVVGSAVLGGLLGGGTGLAVGAMTKQPDSLLQGSTNISTGYEAPDSNAINKAIDANSTEIVPTAQGAQEQFAEIRQQEAQLKQAQDQAQAQAAEVAAQQAQAQDAQAEQDFKYKSAVYGINPTAAANQYRIGNKQFFNTAQAAQFIQGMEELNQGLGDELKFMIGAAVNSGALKIDQKATPKSVNNAAVKFLSDYGLADATGVDDAVSRIESIIQTLEGPKALKEADVLNNFYKSITGTNSPAFDALQLAAQPKLTKGASNERLQLQDNAGLRAVPVQGRATQTSGTESGNVRPPSVQSVQPGSIGAGSPSLQAGAIPSGGIPTSTGTNVSRAAVPNANQEAQVISDERVDAINQVENIAKRAFGERDYKIIMEFIQSDAAVNQSEVARQFGISRQRVNQIVGAAKEGESFSETIERRAQESWGPRFLLAGRNMGYTQDEVRGLFEVIQKAQDETSLASQQQAQALSEGATEEDLQGKETTEGALENEEERIGSMEEVIPEDFEGTLGFEDTNKTEKENLGYRVFTPGVSGETGIEGASSTNRAKFSKKELTKMSDEQLQNIAADEETTEERLDDVINEMLRRQEIRVNKGKESAVQKPSAEKKTVRNKPAASEGVRKQDTEERKAAREGQTAEKGKIGPHEYRGTDKQKYLTHYIDLMKAGKKPAAVIENTDGNREVALFHAAEENNWLLQRLHTNFIGPVTVFAVDKKALDTAVAAVKHMNEVGETQQTATELGRALGYSEADINAWHEYQSTWEKPLYKVVKEVKTDEEAAAEAWNEGIKDFPEAPKFADLTEEQQDDWISFGPDNWTKDDVQTELVKLAKSPEYSKVAEKGEASNAEEVRKELKDFIGGENVRRVEVFQSVKDLPLDARIAANPKANDQAFVWKNKAYLIADNIKPGTARAVFMHEVGSHLGIQKMLTEKQFDFLVDSVLAWAKKDDGSIESVIAKRALERSSGVADEQANTELIAYFIEEAMLHNIDPTATKADTQLGRWFRSLWAAFKTAIRRLNMFDVEKLNAQDVINIAYGAARLEVAGTWHGTAASFRKFNHKYMGTGEGAQAFGWGTYLAQKAGIAHQYWKTDVKNKTKDVGYRYKGKSVKEMRRYEMQNLGQDIENKVALDVIREMNKPVSAMMGLSVKNRTPLQAIKDEIAAWQKRIDNKEVGTISGINQRFIDALNKLNPLDFSTVKEDVPGSLMRVDINATPDELLDLDKPIKEQKAIMNMLMERMHTDVQEALVDETNQDISDMTGHDLYFGLKSLELRDGMLSGFIKTFENINKADEAVSKYLYELGIKGNQFKDATSRKNTPEEKATKNIVMFNDEDIFRALSLVGADTEKVQFSKKPLNQIREQADKQLDKLPTEIQKPVRYVTDTIENFAKNAIPYAAFTEDLADIAAKFIPSVKKYVGLMKERQAIRTRLERQVDDILQAYDKLPNEVKGTGENSVNKFLMDSTREGKWAYNPGWIKDFKDEKDIDVDMQARFDTLPEAAQLLIERVFAHGQSTLLAMQKSVIENINTEYDALIAAAKTAGNVQEEQDLIKKKAASLTDYRTLMRLNSKKPYAPLKRFGDYVVVGKSQQYLDNEKIVNDETSTPDAKTEAAKKLRELEKNDMHYFVQFAETVGEAKALARQEANNYAQVEDFEKDTSNNYGGRDIQSTFHRLRNLVEDTKDSNLGDASERAVNRLLADLHLTLLSEQSARQSERRRRGIGGAEKDMMRAFATQGRATASFISSLENTGNIYDVLREMKTETDKGTVGTRAERRKYYNEFMKRHFMGMDYRPSPFMDKALSTTSMWMLLTNPSYYLQNMTQPFMMSLPVLGAKHGYARSWKEMTRAYTDIASVIKKHGLSENSYNKLPEDVRNVVQELVNRGRIDISLEQDLGRWRSTEDSKLAKFGRATELMRGMAQDIETINRVATAVAAYRMEVKSSNPTRATNYADKIIYTTHGDYSGFNAPRITRQGLGRLATQFRKFQLIQISLIARLYNDAFHHEDADTRLIGKKALAYTLGHTAVMGGIMGLPGFAAVATLYGMLFGDKDEPENPELALRRAIGDDTIADLLVKGVPAALGVDVSGKLGMGQMLSILPYTDVKFTRKDLPAAGYALLTGPFGGLTLKAADGMNYIGSGDYQKGLEQLLPSGLGNLLKAERYATEGITTRAGDVVMKPEDIGAIDAFMVALGLPTKPLTDRNFLNAAKFQYDEFYNEKASEIKREYVRAYKEGDNAGLQEARDDWKTLQESRAKNGYSKQPLSNLLKAPQEQKKRERNVTGGVQFNKSNRGFVKQTSEL